jgi:hypothetical protein
VLSARPWTLPAAAWLAAAEAGALIAALALRGVNGAAFYIALLVVKLPFCALVVQRRPGAYLALLVWELGGIVTAVAASGTSGLLRLLEVLIAATVTVLLVASTPLFPTVTLPETKA